MISVSYLKGVSCYTKSETRLWWVVGFLPEKISCTFLMNTLISVELFRCVKEQLSSLSAFCYIILILYEQFLIKSFYSKLILFYVMLDFYLERKILDELTFVYLMLLFTCLSPFKAFHALPCGLFPSFSVISSMQYSSVFVLPLDV